MRLTILCKRCPQQRDLLTRPYGRFHHLRMPLSRQGHQVQFILVSHQRMPAERAETGGVDWSSLDLRTLGPQRLYSQIRERAANFRPDWIVGFSDATFGWLAGKLARKLDVPLALDAYDDYEAYMPWNFPLHRLWRRAIARAELVTAAGPQLRDRLQAYRSADSRPAEILPMSADPTFVPIPKPLARSALGLPLDAPLVGYSGSWGKHRGTQALLPAFREVRRHRPDALLVLSGSPPREILGEAGVLSLGRLADEQMPQLMNALDVACVIATDSKFGRNSYPAKLCEAVACGTPVAASATGPIRWMLQDDPRWLVAIDSVADLAERIRANLDCGQIVSPPQDNWDRIGEKFGSLLSSSR